MSTPPVDLSDMTQAKADQGLGELVRLLLTRRPVAVLLLHPEGTQVTTLSPSVLQQVPPDALAEELVGVWETDAIVDFLEQLYGEGSDVS